MIGPVLWSTDHDVSLETIVVDNASEDETVRLIREHSPTVKIIQASENRGFGGGNNLGFASASGEFVALINSDLVVEKNTLVTLVQYLQENPEVGVIAPRTLNEAGMISQTARSVYTPLYIAGNYLGVGKLSPRLENGSAYAVNLSAEQPQEVAWLQGSCLVLRHSLYAQLGGFDENFFLYVEDVDLCKRIHSQGLKVVYHPSVRVMHVGATSTGRFPFVRVRGYHLSPLYYFRKRHKPAQVRLLKLLFTIELATKSLVRRIRNLFRYDALQVSQANAEIQVLLEVWRF